MNKFSPKRRFRQRDLLPKGIAVLYAHRDYMYAGLMLLTEDGKPMTPENLLSHSNLLDIEEQSRKVLEDSKVPEFRWGEVPPVSLSHEWRDADERCEGR